MKLCVAGKNNIAVNAMEYLLSSDLIASDSLLACYNDTDDGQDTFQKSYKKFCNERGIESAEIQQLEAINDLIFISLEFDKIINTKKMKSDKLFNIHFSFLPKYRGMYTSVWPILYGDSQSGVSLHLIDSGIDTGDIISQIPISVSTSDTCRDLYLKYIEQGFNLFKRNIASLIDGNYQTFEQPAVGASYYSKSSIDFDCIEIDLKKTAWEIHNQLRAFSFQEYQLPKIYDGEVIRSEILETRSHSKAGTVLKSTNAYIEIATIDYDLRCYIKA